MQKNTDNMKKVVSATDSIEASMFVNLLKNNGIPAYTVDKESGDYLKVYMGYTIFGVDIYVNEEDYEQAFALLAEVTPSGMDSPEKTSDQEKESAGQGPAESSREDEEDEEDQGENLFSALLLKRHTAARIIIGIFVGLPCLYIFFICLQSLLLSTMRR